LAQQQDHAQDAAHGGLSQHPERPALLPDECGPTFKFDLPFMAWLKSGSGRTMGDAVDEWLRRNAKA
jgi:hypothetical protein